MSTSTSMPLAGSTSGQYDQSQGNGVHMPPPPVPPLNIPHNSGGVPLSANEHGSPGGGSVTRAAPEPNKRALYVGGLDPRVTEEVLKQIFETAGHVQSVKIIPDKNVSSHISALRQDTSPPFTVPTPVLASTNFNLYRPRDLTTALLSTTIPLPRNEACHL